MRLAILADIHGNVAALEAVMARRAADNGSADWSHMLTTGFMARHPARQFG